MIRLPTEFKEFIQLLNASDKRRSSSMKSQARIELPEGRIAEFCQRHHITKLSLFGSILRDDFRPDSDVDILVEFDPRHIPGLLRFAAMENELSDMLHRKVDLRTPEDLSRYFRLDVLKSAEIQYAS
jgi:predicted nucleotidyltransferase